VPPQFWSLLVVGQRDQGWRDDHDRKYFPCLGAFQWRRDAFCCDPDHSIQRDKASPHSIRVMALWLVLQLERAPCLPQLVYRKAFAMIAMQTPSATPSTGIATMPKISATRSAATRSVNGLGRRSSEFALMAHLHAGTKAQGIKAIARAQKNAVRSVHSDSSSQSTAGTWLAPKSSLSFMSSIPRTRLVFSYKYGVSQRFHS
jgi:hypothetical protein